jgi:hypothetical protein
MLARALRTVARAAPARACQRHICSKATPARTCISQDFGARDGQSITNKATVLREVDEALGLDRPPDLEVLLTDHLTCTDSRVTIALHTLFLRFGHVAVRYTTSDGVQRVMNILGSLDVEGSRMVNFVPPEEYLYGTRGWDSYAQQGGAYNRDVVGVRVERCAPGAIDAMHSFFEALHVRSQVGGNPTRGAARFQLLEARLSSVAQHLPPLPGRLLTKFLDVARRSTEFLSRDARPAAAADAPPAGERAVRKVADIYRQAMSDVRHAQWTAGNWYAADDRTRCHMHGRT